MRRINLESKILTISIERIIAIGVLCFSGWVVKLALPELNYDQVALLMGLLGFYWEYSDNQKKNEAQKLDDRFKQIESSIIELSKNLDKLGDDYRLHRDSYSHPGIETAFRDFQERSLTNSAQISSLWAALKLKTEIQEIKDSLRKTV